MYQRRPRKFSKYRSNGRSFQNRGNGNGRSRTQSYSNEPPRNNFRTIHNPEKLLEKYNNLAKEALSSGDKTLSENYLQHADHFVRLLAEKNKNYQLNKDKNNNEVINLDKKKEEVSDGLVNKPENN
tara:strand:- start:172 stop:549 length:378 start_codon:yes stop_codon:yes gene_type:complete